MNESMINRGERTNHAQYWKFEQKWFVLDRDLILSKRESVWLSKTDYPYPFFNFMRLGADHQIEKSEITTFPIFVEK